MMARQTYWALIDPIWDSVSIYDGGDTFLKQFQKVTLKQQVLFATHWAQSEILNGGLHQFYSNSTGVLAPEAAHGFKILGMKRCRQAIRESMKFFGNEYPRERGVRDGRLDEYEAGHPDVWDPFIAHDDIFFDSIESEEGGYQVAATRYAYS